MSVSTLSAFSARRSHEPTQTRAQEALAALGQQTRLAIFRLLMRHEPRGMATGEVALAVRCPQNTASGHLAILSRAQLATGLRRGRSVVYRADVAGMRWLMEYLLADCCNGEASLCAPFLAVLQREDRSSPPPEARGRKT